jgi:hypothetical protein
LIEYLIGFLIAFIAVAPGLMSTQPSFWQKLKINHDASQAAPQTLIPLRQEHTQRQGRDLSDIIFFVDSSTSSIPSLSLRVILTLSRSSLLHCHSRFVEALVASVHFSFQTISTSIYSSPALAQIKTRKTDLLTELLNRAK